MIDHRLLLCSVLAVAAVATPSSAVTAPLPPERPVLTRLAADAIVWDGTYDEAVERARSESKVLMVAVHLVGEPASAKMLKDVYTDDRVVELSASTVNLGTSNAYQGDDEAYLEYFGAPSREAARKTDIAVREQVLKPDADGFVIAPQHVFLGPDGAVLLSVPYAITAAELEWCLVESLHRVDPESKVKFGSRARAPRRLVLDGVHDGGGGPAPVAPPDAAELKKLLHELDDLEGGELMTALGRLAASDDRRAVKEVEKHLRNARPQGEGVNKRKLLRVIGEVSPEEYWEMVSDELAHKVLEVRNEAAVALEQLGAAKAESQLIKSLGREKEPRVRKNIARALGASGYDSAKALRELARVAKKDDDSLVRVNAILAIGRSTPNDDGRELLAETLAEGDEREQAAALIAMVWSRDPFWRELLPQLLLEEPFDEELTGPLDADVLAALRTAARALTGRAATAWTTALDVSAGGSIEALAPHVTDIGGDTVPRRRLFASATADAPSGD
ncbi:HEAT repeat domain-containing protein [Rohdeia mirabilis]|uniref:HEAT repeat domain-containing protein n=1 Tax=Rohdeia mirabilis TaxID=2528008 RepID=UPI003AF331ED